MDKTLSSRTYNRSIEITTDMVDLLSVEMNNSRSDDMDKDLLLTHVFRMLIKSFMATVIGNADNVSEAEIRVADLVLLTNEALELPGPLAKVWADLKNSDPISPIEGDNKPERMH